MNRWNFCRAIARPRRKPYPVSDGPHMPGFSLDNRTFVHYTYGTGTLWYTFLTWHKTNKGRTVSNKQEPTNSACQAQAITLFSRDKSVEDVWIRKEFADSGCQGGMNMVMGIPLIPHNVLRSSSMFQVYFRDAKRPTKKSAKPSNFNFLMNQRPATEILTNGITWREIHFGFWTNQRTIKSLLASLFNG